MDQIKINTLLTSLQGVGVGLRSCHYHYILSNLPNVSWFEVLADNYLVAGGPQLNYLDKICSHYPVAMHSVGMSIGSTDPLNFDYIKKLKQLAERIQPVMISDHLSWVSIDGQYLHDLLPLPFTEETILHVVERIQRIQDLLKTQILIENISSYLQYNINTMPEWDFINTIVEKADCYILLDINNIYVSSTNHHYDPKIYIDNINKTRVKQYHLAGYTDKGNYLFDTHSEAIHPPVWDLYHQALKQIGNKPTLIEWDGEIPKFTDLLIEVDKAKKLNDEFSNAIA